MSTWHVWNIRKHILKYCEILRNIMKYDETIKSDHGNWKSPIHGGFNGTIFLSMGIFQQAILKGTWEWSSCCCCFWILSRISKPWQEMLPVQGVMGEIHWHVFVFLEDIIETSLTLYTELRCSHEFLRSKEPFESKTMVHHMYREWGAPRSSRLLRCQVSHCWFYIPWCPHRGWPRFLLTRSDTQ